MKALQPNCMSGRSIPTDYSHSNPPFVLNLLFRVSCVCVDTMCARSLAYIFKTRPLSSSGPSNSPSHCPYKQTRPSVYINTANMLHTPVWILPKRDVDCECSRRTSAQPLTKISIIHARMHTHTYTDTQLQTIHWRSSSCYVRSTHNLSGILLCWSHTRNRLRRRRRRRSVRPTASLPSVSTSSTGSEMLQLDTHIVYCVLHSTRTSYTRTHARTHTLN